MIQIGNVLLGKYRIERVLGEGGMGVVALAHHIQLDQPVAIKFLRPEVLGKHTVVKRFLREAQAAVKLRSEHVCKVHDVGTLENGSPYMVMEFMDGMELGDLARERGRLPPGEVVDLVLQACEALAEAHALGIVHRDIKPANLFVTRRPDGSALLKVLDFGISKAPAGTELDTDLTSTQAVMGTPAYMSPEQMRASKHVDGRADVWALGVVLYELIEGKRPFPGRAFSELCLQVGMDPTPPMAARIDPGLEAAVARCLEKEPGRRFGNVAELAAALAPHASNPVRATIAVERAARVLGVATIPPAAPAAEQTSEPVASALNPPTTLSATAGQIAIDKPQRRRWLIGGTAVTVLTAATLIVMFAGGSDATDSDASGAARPAASVPEETGEPGGAPLMLQTAAKEPAQTDAGVALDPAAGAVTSSSLSLSADAGVAKQAGADKENEAGAKREAEAASSRDSDTRRSPRGARRTKEPDPARASNRTRRNEEPEPASKTRSRTKSPAAEDDVFDIRR
jgi:eukaryotic-like serine/threonine-protein kinase